MKRKCTIDRVGERGMTHGGMGEEKDMLITREVWGGGGRQEGRKKGKTRRKGKMREGQTKMEGEDRKGYDKGGRGRPRRKRKNEEEGED